MSTLGPGDQVGVKSPARANPYGVSTEMAPSAGKGTRTWIFVSSHLTTARSKRGTESSPFAPSRTAELAPVSVKPLPVMVTVVPHGPAVGSIVETCGGGSSIEHPKPQPRITRVAVMVRICMIEDPSALIAGGSDSRTLTMPALLGETLVGEPLAHRQRFKSPD
jgi:hypothetical protein